MTYSGSNYQPYGTNQAHYLQTDSIKISAPLMPLFAVACPSPCNWRILHQMALIHIISLNRKFNCTTKLFSELFPLGHWGEATVTPISEHIPSYFSTTAPKHQNEMPSRCTLLTKSANQGFCLIFGDFFSIILMTLKLYFLFQI